MIYGFAVHIGQGTEYVMVSADLRLEAEAHVRDAFGTNNFEPIEPEDIINGQYGGIMCGSTTF